MNGVVQESAGDTAAYSIKGDECYVGAQITDSNGKTAWTQSALVK
jgi:hypothetical protein